MNVYNYCLDQVETEAVETMTCMMSDEHCFTRMVSTGKDVRGSYLFSTDLQGQQCIFCPYINIVLIYKHYGLHFISFVDCKIDIAKI